MLAGMSPAELVYWRHVYSTEFIGADREYLVGAKLEALYWNSKRSSEDEPMSPVDRIPFMPRDEEEQDDTEDVEAQLPLLFQRVNARVEEEQTEEFLQYKREVEARMNSNAASITE